MNWKSVMAASVAALLFVAAGLLINELRKPPGSSAKKKDHDPLTDVARARKPPAIVARPPSFPVASTAPSASQPVAVPVVAIPPEDMEDPSNPPQWTKTLAEPGEPNPPDPFTPPPIVVDPDRGRRVDAGTE